MAWGLEAWVQCVSPVNWGDYGLLLMAWWLSGLGQP